MSPNAQVWLLFGSFLCVFNVFLMTEFNGTAAYATSGCGFIVSTCWQDKLIVGFGLFMGFADNNKKSEICQLYPLMQNLNDFCVGREHSNTALTEMLYWIAMLYL